jgi:hypothetical protein
LKGERENGKGRPWHLVIFTFFHRILHRFSKLVYYTMKEKVKLQAERAERRKKRRRAAAQDVSDYSSTSPLSRGGKTKPKFLAGHYALRIIIYRYRV